MDVVKTGYSAVDKPWLRFFDEETINAELPKGSLYEYMRSVNSDRQDAPAISFMGSSWTHREFDAKIEECARALIAHGVKKGDIVSVCMLTMPEALVLLYAINRVGAVCSFLIFNAPEVDIRKQIIEAESKLVFTVHLAAGKIKSACEGTGVKEIVSVPFAYSMAFLYKTVVNFKYRKAKTPDGLTQWSKFLASGKGKALPKVDVDENALAVLEYTSGTTGEAKGAMLSNKAINSAAFNYGQSKNVFEFHDGERFMSIVCPFLSVGLVTTMIMPLCTRLHLILCPDPSPEATPGYVAKYKPSHFCVGSLNIEAISKSEVLDKMDLSFISTAAYGGEKSDSHWEKRVSDFFFAHGMKHELVNGYGMTEACGSFCTTTHKTNFMIPFAKNNVMITDIDTDEELGYDQEGQVCISGPSLMLGYFKKPEATDEVMFERNGVKWLKTGDLGKVSEDGSFTITGRLKRILYAVGENGAVFRVFPMKIEETICACEDVEHCAVVGKKDPDKGYITVAFIVPKDENADKDAVKAAVTAICEKELSETSRPSEIRFVPALPATRAGKVDFKALEASLE